MDTMDTRVSKKIIIIGLIVLLVIVIAFIITHKSKYEIALERLMKIDEVDSSEISTKKRSLKYNNSIITYNVSTNVEEIGGNIYRLKNNDTEYSIFILPTTLDVSNTATKKERKKFTVNGREFLIGEHDEVASSEVALDTAIFIITKIKDNSYCAIIILSEKIELTENDLKNIKPFFEMTIK